MMNGSDHARRDERLSALVDGELDAAQVAAVCARWRDDSACRHDWHAYQLIGDVLRSDDLASAPAHDSEFLARLRTRLAEEPVVLAPAALEADAPETAALQPERRTGRMAKLGAVAAGFLVVAAGALTFTNLAPDSGADSVLAVSGAPAARSAAATVPDALVDLQPTVASGELIRDAQLDRYLAAHQQWTGGAMLAGHAAYLRPPVDAAPVR